jgi:hypothetical protein
LNEISKASGEGGSPGVENAVGKIGCRGGTWHGGFLSAACGLAIQKMWIGNQTFIRNSGCIL